MRIISHLLPAMVCAFLTAPAFAASADCGSAEPCTGSSANNATLFAFATSTLGTGDLHSWAEVADTDLAGLAAGDGICQARARAANLPNAGDFVAWLSDHDDDAYCRMFGLSGKKASNCGLPALPVGAGPWLRTDGVPFAGTIEDALAANLVYSTLNVDESGTAFFTSDHVGTSDESFTATDIDGTFKAKFDGDADCSQWTSTVTLHTPALGSNLSAGGDWTFDEHGAACSTHQHLMCLQRGSGPALSGHAQFGRREAFVTGANVTGNLGGLAGADAICRNSAAAAHLYQPDSFKALLGSSSLANITQRLQNDGPWYRRDGLVFAYDKAELVGGAVTLPLNVTESGEYLGISVALTGVNPAGTPLSRLECADWTSTASSPAQSAIVNAIARTASNGTNWLSGAQISCTTTLASGDWSRKLFCLSDADVVFHAEFDPLPTSP